MSLGRSGLSSTPSPGGGSKAWAAVTATGAPLGAAAAADPDPGEPRPSTPNRSAARPAAPTSAAPTRRGIRPVRPAGPGPPDPTGSAGGGVTTGRAEVSSMPSGGVAASG